MQHVGTLLLRLTEILKVSFKGEYQDEGDMFELLGTEHAMLQE